MPPIEMESQLPIPPRETGSANLATPAGEELAGVLVVVLRYRMAGLRLAVGGVKLRKAI